MQSLVILFAICIQHCSSTTTLVSAWSSFYSSSNQQSSIRKRSFKNTERVIRANHHPSSSSILQLSSSSSSSSSSYESWGDGNLIPETFSDLYSLQQSQHIIEDDDSTNSERSSSSSYYSMEEGRPYLPQWLINRTIKLGYTNPTLLQLRALDMLLPRTRRMKLEQSSSSQSTISTEGENANLHQQESQQRNQGMLSYMHKLDRVKR